MTDKLFQLLLKQADQSFSGWDFSFITATGRVRSDFLSWSYGSIALSLIQGADSMLDMGTGGGEFLAKLRPFPREIYATESYLPNVPIAKERLTSLGVHVVQIEQDENLPFATGQFDLAINQHESYSAKELHRILTKGGIFLTQQVGGLEYVEMNERLTAPAHEQFLHWQLDYAIDELEKHGFKILQRKEEFPLQRFYDIGALVYYLKAIPWHVPDFTIEKYRELLYAIHQTIVRKGYFDVKQHRFMLVAKAI